METSERYEGIVQSIEYGYVYDDVNNLVRVACCAEILVNNQAPYKTKVYYAITAYTGDVPFPTQVGERVIVYIYNNTYIFTLPYSY